MDGNGSILQWYKDQVKRAVEKGNKDEEISSRDSLGQVYISLEQFIEAIQCHTRVANIAIELGLGIQEGRAYYKIAHSHSSLGNYKKAIEYYQKCLHILQGKGDSDIERMAYCNLGNTYFVSGNSQQDYSESIKYLGKSLSMASEAKDVYVEARACYYLGNSYVALGKYEEAISYYERSLRNDGKARMIYRLIGNAYFQLKKYQEAIKNHHNSLESAMRYEDKEAQKTAYLDLGIDSHVMRKYGNAVSYFQQYLNMAKTLRDRKGEVEAHRFMGNAYFELQKNEEALRSHLSSLSTAVKIGDQYGEECAYANMGIAYHKLQRYQEAIGCYERRLNVAVHKGDRKEEIKASSNIARAYTALRNYEKAIVYHKKTLQISKEIGDTSEEATAYSNIAELFSLSTNYKEALEYYKKYLQVAIEMDDKESQRKAYNIMGDLYGKMNLHKESIECLERELEIVVENGDAPAEAEVYCNLGNDYVAIGRYQEAFQRYNKCLTIALEYEDEQLQELVYCNIGNAYWVLGNQPEADKYYRKSSDIAIRSRDPEAEARGYCILSRISSNSGDYKKALEYSKRHLQLIQLLGNKHTQVLAYHDVGRNSFLTGKYQDAMQFLEKSANIANEIGDKKAEGEAYEYLGYVYQDYIKNYRMAVHYHTAHLNIATDIGDKNAAGKACRNLGTAFLFQFLRRKVVQNKEKAENYLKESLKWYDLLFQDIGEQDQHKVNLVDTLVYTQKLLVEFYIETGQPERALLVSEQERGRALEDLLTGKYKIDKNVDTHYDFLGYADIVNKVLSRNCSILLFSDLMKMRRSNSELQVGTWVLDLDNRPSFYRNELKEIKELLKAKSLEEDIDQDSKDVLHDVVDITYNTMSARGSTDVSTAENRSFSQYLIGSLDNDEGSSQELETSKRNTFDEELDDHYFEVLFDALITPVQDELTHEEIVIIPEGSLFKVPFAALRDPKTHRYLSETKCIRIAPSLTTLKILKESSAESHFMKGAIIVGDPDVEGKRMLKGKERYFNPLPNARLEAEEIGCILGVNALLGAQATKQTIKERLMEGVAVIHFATHGCADSGEIVLSPPGSLKGTQTIPSEDDYLLTISEVQEIGLRAKLVVLSCCHDRGRDETKSDGVIGMSQAFLAAGALAVVASLWDVDDEVTRVFMQKFYTQLKQGKSASKSLQQAMKEMREMVQYQQPSFWAPFVLIGDDVTVSL